MTNAHTTTERTSTIETSIRSPIDCNVKANNLYHTFDNAENTKSSQEADIVSQIQPNVLKN